MSKFARSGTLVISLDVDGPAESAAAHDEAKLAAVDGLLSLLRSARMSATWCSRAPSASKAVTEALAEPIGHEIALQAGDANGRCGTRELSRQVQAARAAGYEITTLAAPHTPAADVLQEVSRAGLQAVAVIGKRTEGSGWLKRMCELISCQASEPPQPHLLRYGLWEVPPAISPGSRESQRALLEAAGCGDVLHAHLKVSDLRQGRAGGLKRFERFLQTAFELRSEHRLAVRTVGDLVGRLRAEGRSLPAQSILRRAA